MKSLGSRGMLVLLLALVQQSHARGLGFAFNYESAAPIISQAGEPASIQRIKELVGQSDRAKEVLVLCDMALQNTKSGILFFYRGWAKAELKDFRGAVSDYSEAYKIEPSFAGALANRGWAKYMLNDPKGALQDMNIALKAGQDRNWLFNRAIVKSELKDYHGALLDYDASIKLNPSNYLAYNNRGNLKRDFLDDVSGAIEDYTLSIRINPEYPKSYGNRALARQKNNDYEGACKDMKQAADLGWEAARRDYSKMEHICKTLL